MALSLPKAFWPITITAGLNDAIDVTTPSAQTVRVAAGTYYSPTDLLAAVAAALAPLPFSWIPGSVSSSGRVALPIPSAGVLTFRFGTGPNVATSIHSLLGFANLDLSATLGVAVSQYQHANGWYAVDPPQDDTGEIPEYQVAVARSRGMQTLGLDFGTTYRRDIALAYLPAWKVFTPSEGSGNTNEAIQRLFDPPARFRFRWWSDGTSDATASDYLLDPEASKKLPRNRFSPGNPRYSVALALWKWSA